MKSELIIIKPAELILKGTPIRAKFEAQLIRNIRAALKENKISFDLKRIHPRILVYANKSAILILKNIFGIVTLAPAVEIETDFDAIKTTALKLAKLNKTKSFAVRTKRVTKEFKFTSQQINEKIGTFIQKRTKAKVNLKKPDVRISIELIGKKTFIFTKVTRGRGGLPVGTQGKVICLISDKDSVIAAQMMLKRGAEIILLNASKTQIKQLQKFSAGYEIKSYSNKSKNLMLAAEKLAKKLNAKAIVIGTRKIKDAAKAQKGINLPVFAPLAGLGKKDIAISL